MTASTSLQNGNALLNDIYDELMTGSFYPAIHRLCEILDLLRNGMPVRDWREFCKSTVSRHPIRTILSEGPITGQWLRSPPEGGVDSLAFDLVCGRTVAAADATGLGKMLYGWEYGLPFSEALRSRRDAVARELNEIAREHKNATVLSLGHSWVVETTLPQVQWPGGPGLDDRTGHFDFIYALDFFDTADTVMAVNILPKLLGMLKPNGRLIAANLTTEIPEAAYLEACMDYWPKYRSEEEMAALAVKVPEKQVSSQCVFRDESGCTVFLELQRSGESG